MGTYGWRKSYITKSCFKVLSIWKKLGLAISKAFFLAWTWDGAVGHLWCGSEEEVQVNLEGEVPLSLLKLNLFLKLFVWTNWYWPVWNICICRNFSWTVFWLVLWRDICDRMLLCVVSIEKFETSKRGKLNTMKNDEAKEIIFRTCIYYRIYVFFKLYLLVAAIRIEWARKHVTWQQKENHEYVAVERRVHISMILRKRRKRSIKSKCNMQRSLFL